MDVSIRPAEDFDDVQAVLSGGGDGRSCQCQWWTLSAKQFDSSSRDERAEMLRAELTRMLAPGLIAYIDEMPAGWVRVGPRRSQLRFARMPVVRDNSWPAADDETGWAITCFSVRKQFRGQGLTGRMIAAAIEFARTHGARVVEAYAVVPGASREAPNPLFHGTLSTFQRAGFETIARVGTRRALVSLRV
jgi:GNAT superfamily N-acetyltransferase